MLDWSTTPKPDSSSWHAQFGGQEWRHDELGVYLAQGGKPLRTAGVPRTCQAILDIYGLEIFEASKAHKVPPELLVMTIATEAGTYRSSDFTGPATFRWEPRIDDYSVGPMQLLGSTARALLKRRDLPKEWKKTEIPKFAVRPSAPPSLHPLYEGRLSIWLGAAYIASNVDSYAMGYDPILVAACYNRGRIVQSASNPWHLAVTRDHIDRAAERYGDACAILATLRSGQADPPSRQGELEKDDDRYLEIYSLSIEQAEAEKTFFLDSDADVDWIDQDDGLVTLVVTYPAREPTRNPVTPTTIQPPTEDGFVLCIDRKRVEERPGKGFGRTVGLYQAFFDRKPIAGLSGMAVERHGPGDNSRQGDIKDRRIEAGRYPMSTHAGASNKYKTYDYDRVGGLRRRPWPAIRIEGTDRRSGILIHCAAGYIMSVGCINLAGTLPDAQSDIVFSDSRSRVIALIDGMKESLGEEFPTHNNSRIGDALLLIRNEPRDDAI